MIQKLTVCILCLVVVCSCTQDGAWDQLRNFNQPVPVSATVSFQDGANGYFSTKDAHLVEWHPGNNTGANTELEATKHTGVTVNDNKAIVVEFDVSSIPSSATVIAADLSLLLIGQRNGSTPKTLYVHKITGAWIEGMGTGIDGQDIPGVDWASRPAFDALSIDDQLIGTVEDTWYTFDIGSAVQSWVSSPLSNYGVILKEDEVSPSGIDGSKVFASSEYATLSSRPKLTISYTN